MSAVLLLELPKSTVPRLPGGRFLRAGRVDIDFLHAVGAAGDSAIGVVPVVVRGSRAGHKGVPSVLVEGDRQDVGRLIAAGGDLDSAAGDERRLGHDFDAGLLVPDDRCEEQVQRPG